MTDTKDKILNAAERLIGEQGYAATSLRQIIAEAGVNLAAVHYHFGSKEDLLDAVVARKVTPVNEARIARLERVEAEVGNGPPAVLTEGMMPRLVEKHFHATGLRFVAALRRAIPELPQEELIWRVHFMVGAMAHTMCSAPRFLRMPGDMADFEPRMKRLVTFLSAGFRASPTAGKERI